MHSYIVSIQEVLLNDWLWAVVTLEGHPDLAVKRIIGVSRLRDRDVLVVELLQGMQARLYDALK